MNIINKKINREKKDILPLSKKKLGKKVTSLILKTEECKRC
ncbi:hypothetical protein LCGC14_1533760 [marine sediment metagenome]|uniref:Uncharacterized protein n=1 Tax=marine sediment metagenome TaxID=412755 RepID=A0A0F9JFZ1_9ZZZZ